MQIVLPGELADTEPWKGMGDFPGVVVQDEASLLADAPTPTLWYLYVRPRPPKTKSAGGIIFDEKAKEAEMHMNYVGQVVALGPLVGQAPEFKGQYPALKVGDWVVFTRYQGIIINHRGVPLRMLKDEQVLGVVTAPDALRVYVG